MREDNSLDAGDPVERASDDGVEIVPAEPQEVDPRLEDVFQQLSSAILEGGSAFDSASLAVLAQMSGPLPPPHMVREYNHIIPNGASRIMAMAETHQEAVIADRREHRSAERRGQYLAFICVLAILLTGIVLSLSDQEILGTSLSGACLAALVYAFVRGRD